MTAGAGFAGWPVDESLGWALGRIADSSVVSVTDVRGASSVVGSASCLQPARPIAVRNMIARRIFRPYHNRSLAARFPVVSA